MKTDPAEVFARVWLGPQIQDQNPNSPHQPERFSFVSRDHPNGDERQCWRGD